MTDQPEPEDTCRPVEIDGETIRVRGAAELTDEGREALAALVGAARRKMAAEPPPIRQQLQAVAFNAVLPALEKHREWLRLTVRRTVANAVLEAIEGQLDIGEAEAWCKVCRRVWDGPRHRCESDAEQQLARVRAARDRIAQSRSADAIYCLDLLDEALGISELAATEATRPATWLAAGTRNLSTPDQHQLVARPVDPEAERAATERAQRIAHEARLASEQLATLGRPDGLVIEAYRNDAGQTRWVFRCWGDDHCDGLVSLDHTSQRWAETARDRHLAEDHKAADAGGEES